MFSAVSEEDGKETYHMLSKALRISTLSSIEKIYSHIKNSYEV